MSLKKDQGIHMLSRNNKLHYTASGTDRSETLLLIHDNGLSSRMFERDVIFFNNYFRTISIDMAGHGKSGKYSPATGNFWLDNAFRIIETMEKLKIAKMSIIGTGGGAVTALLTALNAPALIRCIIADSPLPMTLDQEYLECLKSFRSSPAETDRQVYGHCAGAKWEKFLEDDTRMQKEFIDKSGHLFEKNISEISSPVLVTGSSHSNFIRNNEDVVTGYATLMKKGQSHIFSGGNHPTILYKTDEFRTLSLNFLMDRC